MFGFVVNKLQYLLEKKPKDSQFQKLRDLFIGIVLNLTCNVENPQIILHMVKQANVINSLKLILTDSRHDWPTNGAALALLQYSHLCMQETEIFEWIEQNQLKSVLENFIKECRSREAKKHMYEALSIIEICRRKLRSIESILENHHFAACA